MSHDPFLKKTLVSHLQMGKAFIPVEQILEKVPLNKVGIRPAGLPDTFYELVYHIQFAQGDILDYCLKEEYQAPGELDDYWPGSSAPVDETAL